MLRDENCYMVIVFNPTLNYKGELDTLMNRDVKNKWITEKEIKFMINDPPSCTSIVRPSKNQTSFF